MAKIILIGGGSSSGKTYITTRALKNVDSSDITLISFDDYYKDIHRLAFAEYNHIRKYQELNQCLEQLPDGRNMNKDVSWEQSAKHYKDMYVGLTPKY